MLIGLKLTDVVGCTHHVKAAMWSMHVPG